MIHSGFSLRRFENAVRLSVPLIVIFLLMLLGFISLPLPHIGVARPFFVLMAVYYWSIYRPTLVPPALCFSMGIVMDILSGGPLGLNALVLLAAQWVARSQRRFLMGQPHVAVWAVFAVILVFSSLAQWGLYGLIYMSWPSILPVAGSVALSLLLFPFVTLLFIAIHRILPVASRTLG